MNESVLFWAMADALRPFMLPVFLEKYGTLNALPRRFTLSELKSLGIADRSAVPFLQKLTNPLLQKNIEKAHALMQKHHFGLISFEDENFPLSLKNIVDPPLFLFFKGNLENIPRRLLAVVGTRMPSTDGKYAIEKIIPPLVQNGVGIVSGMATGIDALAHKQALVSGGKTIAFLGSGLDIIYPSSNTALFQEIAHSGVCFSEFPLGTRPDPYNFPRRNRLVSGFSEGVLVVEGKAKSGSLITADFAMEQGKEVFAVPGSLRNELASGPHKLISEGAGLVQNADDILSVLGIIAASHPVSPDESIALEGSHKMIYGHLSHVPFPFDELSKKMQMSSAELSATLMMMTLLGVVEEVGGGMWIRR